MTIDNIYDRQSIFNIIKKHLQSIQNLHNSKGNINSNIRKMLPDDIIKIASQLYPHYSLINIINCVLNDIVDQPVCEICSKPVLYFRKNENRFAPTCSVACSRKTTTSKEKRKATCREKYGVDNPIQTDVIKNKRYATNFEKFGDIHPTKNLKVKEKISNSVKSAYNSKKNDILDKRLATMIQKYGSHSSSNTTVISTKISTNLKKYGTEYGFQNDDIKNKIKNTLLNIYGVDSSHKLPQVIKGINRANQIRSELADKKFLDLIDNLDTSTQTIGELSDQLNYSYSNTRNHLLKNNIDFAKSTYGQSQIEIQIINYISSLNISNIVINDRKLLNGKEIDIYLPDYNLAIEVDGVYFHSEKFGKNKNYHLDKTIDLQKIGVQLLHIYDVEWNDQLKNKIWKSIIRSKLKMTDRIFARKCQIKQLSNKTAKEFFDENHLQQYSYGNIKLGLYYQEELVSAIIVGKSRYSKLAKLELIRAASKCNITVVGGLSKLLSQINSSIISYADLRYSSGNGYISVGFKKIKNTPPGYSYFYNGKLLSRLKFQKHKLKTILPFFDNEKTERENMIINGYYPVWNCGNVLLIKETESKYKYD